MKTKDLKQLITPPTHETKVYIIDLYALGTITKDKKYETYQDFLEDEKNENYELIERECIDLYLTEQNEIHLDIFIDTRNESRKEELF